MLNGYKTYIGIAIAMIGVLARVMGWNVDWLNAAQEDIVTMVGLGIATYGRMKAVPK